MFLVFFLRTGAFVHNTGLQYTMYNTNHTYSETMALNIKYVGQ